MKTKDDKDKFVLPIQAASRADIGRMIREIEQLDEFLRQSAIRQPGTSVKMPKTSKLLDEFVAVNKFNLLLVKDRTKAQNFLLMVRSKAPVLHMSFNADPSPIFTQKLMAKLRQELHPLVLLHVGLQPTIGAGCILRGTNKYFDFSLREHFKSQRASLIEKLKQELAESTPELEASQSSQTAEPEDSQESDKKAEQVNG